MLRGMNRFPVVEHARALRTESSDEFVRRPRGRAIGVLHALGIPAETVRSGRGMRKL